MMDEFLKERYALVLERIREIPIEISNAELQEFPWKLYFLQMSEWILSFDHVCKNEDADFESLKALYDHLYRPLHEDYEEDFSNPDYAAKVFGADYGPIFAFLSSEIYRCMPFRKMGNVSAVISLMELFVEIYTMFRYEDGEHILPTAEKIQKCIYWYYSDYSDEFVSWRIREQYDPDFSPIKKIIMEADLEDLRYLYSFGEYISDSEIELARYMNGLSKERVDQMAKTFVEGYLRGFEVMRISLEGKCYVTIRGCIGFERVLRSAVLYFREHGLEPVFFPSATTLMNRRQVRVGYQGSHVNKQYHFDHAKDKALIYDRPLAHRHLSALKKAFDECKEWMQKNAGPACLETFGDAPFEPVVKENACHYHIKQQKIEAEFSNQQATLLEEYIPSSEMSYTIIAFPVPSIGNQFKEIFDAIMDVNTLDNDRYRRIQKKLIDTLDQGSYVYVRGAAPNKTAMKVRLHKINDPDQETNFENCCADVNIPVGEVFTSPVLTGTEGLLHLPGVYLNGIYFKDLMLRFSNGEIVGYDCKNTMDDQKNHRLVKDFLLAGRETLPLGEFAIGTNTTAYAAAKKYEITDRLPILIIEKMGPHFAIGDTCYARSEEHAVFNFDGKEIIARNNEYSVQKIYYNCHTDITIPYEEIEEIMVVDDHENMIPIIKHGRFVLEGTEELNIPLNND